MTEMADKQKKEKKENFFKKAAKGTATYAKATKSELKKVSWPTPKQLVNNTVIVVACIIVVGIIIFVLDAIFGLGFNLINNKKLEAPEQQEISTDAWDFDEEDYSDILDGIEFEDVTEGTEIVTE